MTLLAKDEKRLEVIGEGLREARETLARLDLREWEARLVYDRAVDYLGMTADLYLRARHLPRSDSAKRRLTDVILESPWSIRVHPGGVAGRCRRG